MRDHRANLPATEHAALRRQPAIVALGYLFAAGSFSLLSERLFGALNDDPDALLRGSDYRALAFVLATSALLYALLQRAFHRLDSALSRSAERESQRVRAQSLADSTIEAMPGVFYLYDMRRKFLRWNRNFERVSGYSSAEIAGMHPLDFFAGEDKTRVQERIAEVFAVGESSVEASFVPKSGTPQPYFFTGRRVLLEQGECLLGLGVNIAQRKAAEDALRKSEERYRTTLSSLVEGCQLLDFDYRYLYANDAAASHTRRPSVELLGRRMPDVWPGAASSALAAALEQALQQRKPVQAEVELRFDDGSSTWFDVRVRPVPEGVFVMTMDIHERKRAEAALRELNEQLEQRIRERTRDLEHARERAEAADRTKSAFLATMSHELRTPLNSIIGFTGIVLQGLAGPLTDEQSKQLGMVQGSARHLLALINDVLDISKIEAGQLEVYKEPFELRASVQRVVDSVAPLAHKKDLALRVSLPDALGTIRSDQRRFEQILLNLLNNAIKFTERGEITLHVTQPPQRPVLQLDVKDTGVGIKPEDLSKLFQPFRQLDSGLERKHEGTGLGLAICKRLTQLMGGSIQAESTWGEGSVFRVELPT